MPKSLAWSTLPAILALLCAAAQAEPNPATRYFAVSPPDCAGPENIIAEEAREPANVTHVRIQHIGRAGTDELANEVARAPASAPMRFGETWGEKVFFRAEIPHAKFKATLERIKRDAIPAISTDPEDFRVLYFGGGGEIIVGTGSGHDVMLGGSISGLSLSMVPERSRFRH